MTQRIFLVAVLSCFAMLDGHAETRALILASNYEQAKNPAVRLSNPISDGQTIERTLRRAGIDDIQFVREPTYEAWRQSIDAFIGSLKRRDIAFVYFAGHGIQFQGANYFLASDGNTLVGMDSLLAKLANKARGSIVVIDACRNNPLIQNGQQSQLLVRGLDLSQSEPEYVSMADLLVSGEGLAQVSNLTGLSTVVFFSTEPGNVAEDGLAAGSGSPFATALAEELWRRQSLDEVFRRTSIRVNELTSGRQSPWRQGDLPFNVYLAGMKSLPPP